eukprot:COSAG02_NODE_5154_length_4583_cov_14.494202_4_plen_90_part_00
MPMFAYCGSSDSLYLLDIDDHITIDSSRRGNISRFFNHSCNPNIEVRQLDDCRTPHWAVGFFSTRALKKDEELCCESLPQPFELDRGVL